MSVDIRIAIHQPDIASAWKSLAEALGTLDDFRDLEDGFTYRSKDPKGVITLDMDASWGPVNEKEL